MRVDELTPRSSRITMAVKVLSMDEPRDIESGGRVCEGLVGDETGTIVMSFWDDECDKVAVDETIWLKDARASLVRGSLRLSLGKFGSLDEPGREVASVRDDLNLSDLAYAMPRPDRGRGGGRGGGGGGGKPGGGKCFNCGKPGHISRECPEGGGGKPGGGKCFNCGKPGHISRDCPEGGGGKPGGGKCFNCGKPGHISRECPDRGN
ncbi:MAG: hypothetical protein CL960_03850 [Euryarchaeota archaeon]|jgi:hypothetical protein|nr:hypothetical protein [Euryarchaeota archaeon]MDP6363291.1 hypothetical protein [Candidatus Poseidoniia archaeon]MDP6846522.1 hypothetical protein [Candidatus Poseidoniia archaeon]|tara:strand:- start:3795 stop:4415 length:621 start_codon:yes stop_codon:yes gene_type:complete